MDKIKIGTSDIEAAPLGVGTMAWSNSRAWGYGARLSHVKIQAAFGASLARGLSLFDTAEIYGNGQSERIVGKLFQSATKPAYIATKYAPLPQSAVRTSLCGVSLKGALAAL